MTGQQDQIYEDYWDLTMAWTDFNGKKFEKALELTIDYIDKHRQEEYSELLYSKLQNIIKKEINILLESVRKGINELVKLGFISPFLRSYHYLAKQYLKSDKNERKLILSKIIYSNSSFQRSVTKDSNIREINFVIKTLENMKGLDEKYLGTLISVDITRYPDGYITLEELENLYRTSNQVEFEKRKYNQIGYLKGLLKKLDGISYSEHCFYLERDLENIQTKESQEQEQRCRDPYLQRIYKQRLQEECLNVSGKIVCMVENLAYPVLIASHIKPFRDSADNEKYDPNNGLLLSKTLDSLFDLNYISFADDGSIIFYKRVSEDVRNFWQNYKLDDSFMNEERLSYLKYHRQLCESKNK